MRRFTLISSIVVVGLLMTTSSVFGASPASDLIVGDYIEVRSDGVHMEPCFFSDITANKEATLIWHVRSGSYKGVSLDGLTAVAVVVSDRNLEVEASERRSALYIDADATYPQREALENMIVEERRRTLGEVVSVKVLPMEFKRGSSAYLLRVGEVLSLEMPDLIQLKSHSNLNRDLWCEPFEPIKRVKVGEAGKSIYSDSLLSVRWIHPGQSAYMGEFAIESDSGKYVKNSDKLKNRKDRG